MKIKTLDEGIAEDIGHAFGCYDYGAERGLIDAFPSRDAVASFISGYVKMAFQSGMLYSTSEVGEGLGLFDLLVIDLLWWRNTKRIRFSFLPEKKYYQNPKNHIESFLRGIPLFAAAAALTALIVTVL